jgi:hypothetical protein
MILITGSINEQNRRVIEKKYPLVWTEPTANKSLFEINGMINEFGDIRDSDWLVMWTNHPEFLNLLVNSVQEYYHVEDGEIYTIDRDVIDKFENLGMTKVEVITRNWHIKEIK